MGDPKDLSPTFLWPALPFSVDRSFEVWGVFGVTPSAELVMPREPLLPPRIQPQLFVCSGVDETEEPQRPPVPCSPRYRAGLLLHSSRDGPADPGRGWLAE